MIIEFLGVFVILLGISLVWSRLYGPRTDAREPPAIPSAIPFIGHLVGLFLYRNRYYTRLWQKYNLPICRLPVPGGQMYVVNSPDLVLACQKQPRLVSFWFIEAKFTGRLAGMSKESQDMLLKDIQTAEKSNLLVKGLNAIHQAMMPGKALNSMVNLSANTMIENLSRIAQNPSLQRVNLWKWVMHEITIATTDAVYGKQNPYKDPAVESAFWNFADGTVALVANIWPHITASKAYQAREQLVNAFKIYFKCNGQIDSSDLTNARYNALSSMNNEDDLARFEAVNGIAILANSVPTAFWTIFHAFSSPDILKTIRNQASKIVRISKNNTRPQFELDLGKIKEVPILASIVQESLRHRASGTGPRLVLDDLLLNDRYLLKKDSFLIIPNRELHFAEEPWGSDAHTFNATRFLNIDSAPSIQKTAFRGFGGGLNLCPGKFYATSEISVFVIILALSFDIRPAKGPWKDPGQDVSNMSLAIGPPKEEVLVDLVPRIGMQDALWSVVC